MKLQVKRTRSLPFKALQSPSRAHLPIHLTLMMTTISTSEATIRNSIQPSQREFYESSIFASFLYCF